VAQRPDGWLAATSLGVVALAVLLPFTPLAGVLGFAPPSPALLAAIASMAVVCLGCAEAAKRWFYRRMRTRRLRTRRA
jgi:Mg2+-importing ATPase